MRRAADSRRPPRRGLRVIRIALLGAGRIGAMHAENLARHPRFELAAVFDPDPEAARKVAALDPKIAARENAESIFADDSLAAVFIASATSTHCDYLERAARAGKAALCEKPLDLDCARVERCRDELARLGDDLPPIQLCFNRRFDPGHAALRARVAAGEIGALEKLVITSRDPGLPSPQYLRASGGLFRDMMIHDFDLSRAILPQEPIRVFAAAAALVDPALAANGDCDTATAVLQTESGILCAVHCSRRAVYGYDQRVEAFGSEGMLISGNRAATAVESFSRDRAAARDPLLRFFIERYEESYRLQLDAFARVALDGETPSPSFEDGRRALLMAAAAEKSRAAGAFVKIDF